MSVGDCSYFPSSITAENLDSSPGITYRQHLIETVLSAVIVRYDPLKETFMAETIASEAIAIVDAALKIEDSK